LAIIKHGLRRSLAEVFYNEVVTNQTRFYYFIGDTLQASSTNVIQEPDDSYSYELSTRRNIIAAKKIRASDLSFVIRKIEWVSGAVYDDYDEYADGYLSATGANTLRESNFYVVTDENQVYKCISNSGGQPSTVKPTGMTTTVFRTSDGYKWKFMYKIPQTLINRFGSTSYIPVTNPATRLSLSSGGIDRVIVSALGSGYISATITVEGDGTDAVLTPVIENGQIVRVVITDAGVGYSYAKLVVSGIGEDGNPITIENQAKLNAVLAVEAVDTKQESVELNSVPGAIENIKILDGGTNYSEGTTTFNVVGDGTGLVFTPVFNNGVITELKIESAGRNYSYLTITAQD
jgi:hypothetical protein